ncbi:MAG: T9SS type A sorting domain-containing protein [Flavobacteriales bacterium]|nr:T9SS type A sorting domain-containing protein [Flavobacteriales bacterium]
MMLKTYSILCPTVVVAAMVAMPLKNAAQTASNGCSYAGASQYTVSSSCSYQNFDKPGTFGNAVNPSGCSGSNNDDAFGWFTATGTSTTITYNPDNNSHDPIMHLFSGACGSLSNLACANNNGNGGNETITYATTIGTNYLVRIQRNGTNSGMDGQLCIWSVPPPPANDDPCGATPLALGSACTYTTYNSTNATATAGIPAPGCSTYSGGDVWFSFVAPASGAVTIRTTAGSITNLAMALYSATACNGTFTLIECDDNDGVGSMSFLTFSSVDLVVGQTYYLRVWQSGSSSGGTFDLCANTAPAGGDCLYILRMFDSAGDGWGGSTVTVQLGAGAPVNYTLANGNQEVAYINVTTGQLVQISYAAAGGSQNEISYFVQVGAGILYTDGPTPGTGLRYASAATCASLSPPNSDCSGGNTICSNSGFNANPSHTGVKADLNVSNRGCLNSEERQGTWYNFSPSVGGTIEMTIAPTNPTDDYDFAIWGPMASLACPPTGAPYRCSYSALSGNTGLQIGAGDDSEGSGGNKWVNAMTVTAGQVYILYVSNYSRSGLAFNLNWTLTGGASLDCTLLPVEFLGLQVVTGTDDVLLEWATGSEYNSAFFAVERSHNGSDFVQIGSVGAQGYSNSAVHYQFLDEQPITGVNYYRLKQVDADGASSLSNVVTAAFRGTIAAGLPYPNPASTEINLDIDLAAPDAIDLIVMDASGRLVRHERISLPIGHHRLTTPLSGLDAGSYEMAVTLTSGERVHAGRFMVH